MNVFSKEESVSICEVLIGLPRYRRGNIRHVFFEIRPIWHCTLGRLSRGSHSLSSTLDCYCMNLHRPITLHYNKFGHAHNKRIPRESAIALHLRYSESAVQHCSTVLHRSESSSNTSDCCEFTLNRMKPNSIARFRKGLPKSNSTGTVVQYSTHPSPDDEGERIQLRQSPVHSPPARHFSSWPNATFGHSSSSHASATQT